MLTKTDLVQIGNVIDSKLKPIQKDIKTMKSDIAQTRKDVKVIISYFDREYVDLRKRVELIEEHLGIPSKN